MENPVVQARERLGLSRVELAQGCGLRYDQIYLCERGLIARPQRRLVAFLAAVGIDSDTLSRQYAQYREALALQVRQKVGQM